MKGFSVISATSILLAAGILFGILAGIGVWYWGESIWYGACWSSAKSNLKSLASEMNSIRNPDSKPIEHRLKLQSCIAGVVFINGRKDTDFSGFVSEECGEYSGYKSYMIAIPKELILVMNDEGFKKEFEEKYKKKLEKIRDSLKAWDVVKLWMKDKFGRVPPSYCKEFEREFSPSGEDSIPRGFREGWLEQENWNSGAEDYCLEISAVRIAGTEDFNYRIDARGCPAASEN